MITKAIKARNRIESTELTIPVTSPAILRPRPLRFFLSAILAVIIAGIPKRSPGPVSDTTPRTNEVTARVLSGRFSEVGGVCADSFIIFLLYQLKVR
jgi:hypothetical protein